MLYHYTDILSARDILRNRVIKAYPAVLFKDLFCQGESFTTPAICWFSINPHMEMTVLVKWLIHNLGLTPIGKIVRFVFPTGYAGDLGLAEYTEQAGISPYWWQMVVCTGSQFGSHYTTWRVVPHDVPLSECLTAEILSHATEGENLWQTWSEYQ